MLRLEGLEVYYGVAQALKGISLSVGEGQIVCLIGANGAGKTTTLRTISGLQKPAGGRIEFLGQDLTGASPERIVRAGIIHVPEGRRVFPAMKVIENLEMGAYTRRRSAEVQQDLRTVYELFPRLRERKEQKAGTLSGGEQQMLAIGRALMGRPRCLLLDEPSMGLAPIIVEGIFEQIMPAQPGEKNPFSPGGAERRRRPGGGQLRLCHRDGRDRPRRGRQIPGKKRPDQKGLSRDRGELRNR